MLTQVVLLETGLPMGCVLVSSCYKLSIAAEFICSLSPTHDTNHMCLLVLAFKHLFRPVPSSLKHRYCSSVLPVHSASFLFVYLVLKSLLPESCLNCPYLAPEALLFYRSSTLYYLHLSLCPIVYLCPRRDFL